MHHPRFISMLSGGMISNRRTSGSGRRGLKTKMKFKKKSTSKEHQSTPRGVGAVTTREKQKRRKGVSPQNLPCQGEPNTSDGSVETDESLDYSDSESEEEHGNHGEDT